MIKKTFLLTMLVASAVAMPLVKADLIPTAKPVVRISLPRVLDSLALKQEAERQTELPGALLLYPIDARIETMMVNLQKSMKSYEQQEKVRIDILAFEEDVPDYTDDFLEKMSLGENDE